MVSRRRPPAHNAAGASPLQNLYRIPHAASRRTDYRQRSVNVWLEAATMKRILLIEGDKTVADLRTVSLGDEGYDIDWAPSTVRQYIGDEATVAEGVLA